MEIVKSEIFLEESKHSLPCLIAVNCPNVTIVAKGEIIEKLKQQYYDVKQFEIRSRNRELVAYITITL